MNTTDQLPEPELGYIKTDKSNQPAFSARQMREMKDTNQLPPSEREAFEAFAQNCPMGKYSIARRGDGYDSSHTQLMWDAWQARAQVQGEVCPTCGETEPYTGSCGTSNNDTKALCKKPAQATQAEVTDEQIVAAYIAWCKSNGTLESFARAILALRPERVPMTEDQVWNNDALMSANGTAGFKMDALMRIVRATEAHHGITTQAKKETT